MLPRLKGRGRLILSGILRGRQNEFLRAVRRNDFEIVSIKRPGQWIAILARSHRDLQLSELAGGKALRR